MLNQKTKAIFSYAAPTIILLILGATIGSMLTPTTKTITVEKVVEKPVEVIKYVPAVPAPVQTPAPIPFGMDESVAYRYRQCPDIIVAYVIEGTNHSIKPGHVFLEDTWPNFGTLIGEDDLGTAINEQSKIIKLTIKKNACWK